MWRVFGGGVLLLLFGTLLGEAYVRREIIDEENLCVYLAGEESSV